MTIEIARTSMLMSIKLQFGAACLPFARQIGNAHELPIVGHAADNFFGGQIHLHIGQAISAQVSEGCRGIDIPLAEYL